MVLRAGLDVDASSPVSSLGHGRRPQRRDTPRWRRGAARAVSPPGAPLCASQGSVKLQIVGKHALVRCLEDVV